VTDSVTSDSSVGQNASAAASNPQQQAPTVTAGTAAAPTASMASAGSK